MTPENAKLPPRHSAGAAQHQRPGAGPRCPALPQALRKGLVFCIVLILLLISIFLFLCFLILHFSCRLDNIKNKIDDKDALILREKLKRRADVTRAVDKRKAMEKTLKDLHEWVDKLHVKLLDAKASAKLSAKHLKSEKN